MICWAGTQYLGYAFSQLTKPLTPLNYKIQIEWFHGLYLPDAGRRLELLGGPLDAPLVEEERVEVAAVAHLAPHAAVPVDDARALVSPHLRHPRQLRVPPANRNGGKF